jgi:hypothetical protein
MKKKMGWQALVYMTLISGLLLNADCASAPGRLNRRSPNVRVFRAEETLLALPLLGRCDRTWLTGIDTAWSPPDQEAARVTREVRTMLRDSSESDLSGFRLQYFGVVRGTVREILVNAFHEDLVPPGSEERPGLDWKTTAVVFCDGGRFTFQAEYDVDSERLGPIHFGRSF